VRPGTGAGRWALGHVAFRLGNNMAQECVARIERRVDGHDAELKPADSVSTFHHARNRGNCGHGSEPQEGLSRIAEPSAEVDSTYIAAQHHAPADEQGRKTPESKLEASNLPDGAHARHGVPILCWVHAAAVASDSRRAVNNKIGTSKGSAGVL
jgi:hypothetical protein